MIRQGFSGGSYCSTALRLNTHEQGQPNGSSPLWRAVHCGPSDIDRNLLKRLMFNKTSCVRLASCPPPASVMVVIGDPPAGRGQLATSRQPEASRRPPIQLHNLHRNGLPRKPEVLEEWRTALSQGVEVGGLVVRGFGRQHRYRIRIHLNARARTAA